ncbi:MAG: OmpA family protein [Bacteroidales bacterium]|jgi:outer membrane protein OmpA-like peptidoglycan-associated protein|nr:OmpA family protein [Bacteroidales bacterium]
MRIHITGFVIWVIWCFFAAWIYNDHLLPAMRKPVTEIAVPVVQNAEADSLAALRASMPSELLIYFEFNDAEFKPDPSTETSIAAMKAWLEKYPRSALSVTGHSDLVGTEEFNMMLGMKRAEAVGKFLGEKGIPASRIVIESKGEAEPAASYLTAEGRSKNRRTQVTIKMQ